LRFGVTGNQNGKSTDCLVLFVGPAPSPECKVIGLGPSDTSAALVSLIAFAFLQVLRLRWMYLGFGTVDVS